MGMVMSAAYTTILLSGFRLPWPPFGCLDELTPFAQGSLNTNLGADHISNRGEYFIVSPTPTGLCLICGPLSLAEAAADELGE